ncbi:MAG: hypothetical protein ACQEXJ_02360 [Myxococcota bacterium]
MRRVVTRLLIAAMVAGCGPMPGTTAEPDEEEAPTRAETQDEQVHVIELGREDIYYVVDARRGLCFLHEKEAVAQVDCEAIPEAREILGLDVPGPDADRAPPVASGGPSPEERERFRQAYTEIFCAKRRGDAVDPREALSRAGLDRAQYARIEGWLASDEARWRRLTASVLEACPAE